MTCLEIQDHLLDYVDNELPASLQQVVADHLQSCLSCREEVESYRKTKVLLQLRAVPEPQAAYWDKTWEKVYSRLKARVVPLYGNKLAWPSRWLWLKRQEFRRVAVVAAVFFLLMTAVWWSRHSPERQFSTDASRIATSQSRTAIANVTSTDLDIPEDVRRQIELMAVSRAAFGSIDPISKSAMLTQMEVIDR
jgi:anti-sigma factor RsiW